MEQVVAAAAAAAVAAMLAALVINQPTAVKRRNFEVYPTGNMFSLSMRRLTVTSTLQSQRCVCVLLLSLS